MSVYGKPATGLQSSSAWAASAGASAKGAEGEVKTAQLLDNIAVGGSVTIFHDIVVPNSRGQRYNIDHAAVSGNNVLLIDSKSWKPATMVTLGGTTYRSKSSLFSWEQFPPCDKRSVKSAFDDMSILLDKWGANMMEPLVVVWPSNDSGSVNTTFAKIPGGKLVSPAKLERAVRRMAKGEASEVITNSILPHLARR